jgi:hypothetical protein
MNPFGPRSAFTVSVLALLLAAYVLCGCESSTTDAGINVTPAEETRSTGDSQLVLFTASAAGGTNQVLYLPLEWKVSDEGLGHMVESHGYQAVYQSNGKPGNNIITVEDQGTSEGVAVVYWEAASGSTED